MKAAKPKFRHPEVAKAFSAIGPLIGAGRLRDALGLCQQINAIEPGHPHILSQTGYVQLGIGQIEQAMESFTRSILRAPGLTFGYLGVADCHLKRNDIPEAIDFLTTVPAQVARNADIKRKLGRVYRRAKQHALALECFSRVPEADRQPQDYADLAEAADRSDNVELAMRAYTAAAQKGGSKLAALTSIARLHIVRGEFDEARRLLENVLHLDAGYPYAHLYLASELPEIQDPAGQLERAKNALAALGSAAQTQHAAPLRFALFYLHDALADYEEAFRHLADANRIMASEFPFRHEIDEDIVARMTAQFTAKHLAQTGGWGSSDERPIFVFGLPRSGTSIVEHLLANHSQIVGVGESEALDWVPKYFETLTQDRVDRAVETYLRAVTTGLQPEFYFVDKSLNSYHHLGAILQMFPNAHFISCRRHPVDTSFSIFSRMFAGGSLSYSTDLASIARHFQLYEHAMGHWSAEFGHKIKEVFYEDLVAEPQKVMHGLLSFIGLDYESACIETAKQERIVRTASASQIRRPIYTTAVKKWMRYKQHLAPLIEQLGPAIAAYEARNG